MDPEGRASRTVGEQTARLKEDMGGRQTENRQTRRQTTSTPTITGRPRTPQTGSTATPAGHRSE